MIVSVARIIPVEDWVANEDDLLDRMRSDTYDYAASLGLGVDGNEIVEKVYIRFKGDTALSANPPRATHVRVTLEMPAEEIA